MAQPFVGEIRLFAGNFAPAGWAFCDGQIQAISDNETLFALIGTTYGGDGQSTFALPDLRSRVPLHFGNGGANGTFVLSQTGGAETVTLTTPQIPAHTHTANGAGIGQSLSPAAGFPSTDPGGNIAPWNTAPTGSVTMSPAAVSQAGGSQPHNNLQPHLAVNYIISLFGIFPSQN